MLNDQQQSSVFDFHRQKYHLFTSASPGETKLEHWQTINNTGPHADNKENWNININSIYSK